MIVEERALTFTEYANIDWLLRFDTHTSQRFGMSHWRNNQSASVLEADKAPVE